ncbi:hypothetical protein ACIPM2_30255 [Streptomyces sp. NPDC086081]|uniref:hypothetical protein n=1 Tax=unclassified Streptomyces TaxID=2593676 RepID=UPI0037D7A411
MTEYERSRTMPAQSEHVSGRASDVGRPDTWLPDAPHWLRVRRLEEQVRRGVGRTAD